LNGGHLDAFFDSDYVKCEILDTEFPELAPDFLTDGERRNITERIINERFLVPFQLTKDNLDIPLILTT
jgi:hypothetical protein